MLDVLPIQNQGRENEKKIVFIYNGMKTYLLAA